MVLVVWKCTSVMPLDNPWCTVSHSTGSHRRVRQPQSISTVCQFCLELGSELFVSRHVRNSIGSCRRVRLPWFRTERPSRHAENVSLVRIVMFVCRAPELYTSVMPGTVGRFVNHSRPTMTQAGCPHTHTLEPPSSCHPECWRLFWLSGDIGVQLRYDDVDNC